MNRYWIAIALLFVIPSLGLAQSLRQVPSGTTDYLTTGDLGAGYTVAWDSSATGAKTEDLNHNSIGCISTRIGAAFTLKDEIGTAAIYPITVNTAGTDTIDNQPTFTLNTNYESVTFQCDGAHNWVVE